jgi:KDO2-lipid IV(A) lauroyltransferase
VKFVSTFFRSCGDALLFIFLRSLLALMEYLPERPALVLARACIGVLRCLMPRSKAVGLRNLAVVFPQKTEAERQRILAGSYETLARHLVAFAKVPQLTRERAAKMFDYSELAPVWAAARASAPPGVGCIIVTAHFGSFELLVQAHALLDRPLSVLTRPFPSPRLERFWKQRREMFGNRQFSRNNGCRTVISRLREGEDVLLVMDQNVRVHHAAFVDFFGVPAATTRVPASAAIRTGAPVFFAACAEIAPSTYKMLYAPIGTAKDFPGTRAEKVEHMTRAIHREFERAITEFPEQWMWIHRRFKTRPVGYVEDFYGGKEVTAR